MGSMGRQSSEKVTAIIQGGDSGALDPRGRSGGSNKWSDSEYNLSVKLAGFANGLDIK